MTATYDPSLVLAHGGGAATVSAVTATVMALVLLLLLRIVFRGDRSEVDPE